MYIHFSTVFPNVIAADNIWMNNQLQHCHLALYTEGRRTLAGLSEWIRGQDVVHPLHTVGSIEHYTPLADDFDGSQLTRAMVLAEAHASDCTFAKRASQQPWSDKALQGSVCDSG